MPLQEVVFYDCKLIKLTLDTQYKFNMAEFKK